MSSSFMRASSYKEGMPLDPRTKLFMLITLSILMLNTGNENIMLVLKPILALLPFSLFIFSKRIKVAFAYISLFSLSLFFEVYLAKFGGSFVSFIAVAVGFIMTRFAPSIVIAFFLMTTTSVSEFIGSMKRMHITDKLTIPLSVVFRLFPTIKEEAASINDAMKMRNITPKNPMDMFTYRIVPLMISIVKIGEELSQAALTRGFGSPKKRTNMCDIGFLLQDYIYCGICILCLGTYFFRNQIYDVVPILGGNL